jgi:D-alanyl-D-alanine carboxypeptidase (penicillin-binding protein 5/6)
VLLGVAVADANAVHSRAPQAFDPLRDGHGVIVDGRMPPSVKAQSWVVADATTGEILAAKNAHEPLRPASTLKTLTAITLLPRLELDEQYRVRWEDAHVTGSAVGIVPGSHYSVDELFYGLMLPSGNDAARALASANGGLAATVRQMNETAREIGATDTHAVNPTGLDARGQRSSAFDLALFAQQGLERRDFRRYVSTTSTAFPAQEPKQVHKKRDSYMIYNQNPLLINGYRGIVGVKTGYTTEAGRTFVAAAERGGQTLIVALMGIVEPTDMAAERLLEWGWTHGDSVTPVGSLQEPRSQRRSQPVPHPESTGTSLARPPSESAQDDDGSTVTSATFVLLLLTAGAGLIGLGWWLQRRQRPAA